MAERRPGGGKPVDAGARVGEDRLMFRYAFLLAASALADAPKAAARILLTAVDGARS
ncbi:MULTISPECIES: hypothetical protein [unclassified Streptomyces]|uniref:hypothetical protein n=1 Tax=unclassified Streptomyces TaxID=2593676 RepID=UPI00137FD060|nr:hypothetical protein [Streptomyces sp. SID4950]MYQ67274.1 hypothetical protein [Streptomyces sp. SID4950]